jgi:hypothetical protein
MGKVGLLSLRNDVGLLAEAYDPRAGRSPQSDPVRQTGVGTARRRTAPCPSIDVRSRRLSWQDNSTGVDCLAVSRKSTCLLFCLEISDSSRREMHEFYIVVEDIRRISDRLTLYGLRATKVGIMFAVSGTMRMLAKPAASS